MKYTWKVQAAKAYLQCFAGTESGAVQFSSYNETDRSDKLCAVVDLAVFVTELCKSCAQGHARKVVKMLHCDSFDIERIANKWKTVTSCIQLV